MALTVLFSDTDAYGTSVRVSEERKDWLQRIWLRVVGPVIEPVLLGSGKRKQVSLTYEVSAKGRVLDELISDIDLFLIAEEPGCAITIDPFNAFGAQLVRNLDVLQGDIGLKLAPRDKRRFDDVIPIETDLIAAAIDSMKACQMTQARSVALHSTK